MALAGMGTTLIPEMALQQVRRQNNDVATIPLTEKGPHRRIAFVTRLNYARVDDVNLLATIFKKALEADQQ